MKILIFMYEFTITIIENMVSRRWWYLWFFQIVFCLILGDRAYIEPQNSSLFLMMIVWTTIAITLLNVEATYADYVRKMLKKSSYLNMAKATMDETRAD